MARSCLRETKHKPKTPKIYFPTILEIECSTGPGEDSLTGSQMVAFLLCVHMAFCQGIHIKTILSGDSFDKDINPILATSSKLNLTPKV
jgi:hypothetical protein